MITFTTGLCVYLSNNYLRDQNISFGSEGFIELDQQLLEDKVKGEEFGDHDQGQVLYRDVELDPTTGTNRSYRKSALQKGYKGESKAEGCGEEEDECVLE